MGGDAFVVVFLKPEISTGFFKFATDDTSDDSSAPSSSIPGVSAVEAAYLLPNGHILPTVISRIKAIGFEIVDRRMNQLTKAEARDLFSYEQQCRFNDDDQAFAAFLSSISSGPTLSLVLKLPAELALGEANAAIKKWIELAGDWDPVVARKKALAASIPHDQWPLRALCGLNSIQNGISSSPHVCCSRRERFFLLPPAIPQLEKATIVLLPSFHTNFPGGKEFLLAVIAKQTQAIVIEDSNKNSLLDDQVIRLCGLTRTSEASTQQTCDNVVQLAREVIGNNGVDIIVLEGLDLSYTLRFAVGPANVDLAQLYFPESVRAQVPAKLPSVELPAGLYPAEASDDDALGFESGLFLCLDQKLDIWKVPKKGVPIESTLGLIKPNVACKPEVVAEILRMINLFGFTVENQRRLLLSRDQAGAFYAEHRGKGFFETLLNFMTSGEIVALHLSRPHAVKAWRGLMGPTNSIKARESHPWTLRARFGVDGTRNATHGSDATTSAARELSFFFGNALSASSTTLKLPSTSVLKVKAVAQRPLVLSETSESTVEKILAQGLKELMTKNLSDPLEACRWLGEWLVTYRSRGLEEEPEEHGEISRGIKSNSVNQAKQPSVKQSAKVMKPPSVRKVVAITLDQSLPDDLRSAVAKILIKRLEEARYKVVNVAVELEKYTTLDGAVANLVKTLKESGRRRCVLFNCEELTQTSVFHREFQSQAPIDWKINFLVHLDLENGSPSAISSIDVPVFHFGLPGNTQDLEKNGAFDGLLQTVFDPNIVLLVDPKQLVSVTVWTDIANYFGFYLLTFTEFVTCVMNSNDKSNDTRLLQELMRSGSTLPSTLVLTMLRRVILGSQPDCRQKFILLGFPWSEIQASELEQTIGRPWSVLFVGDRQKLDSKANSSDFPAWTSTFRKKGLVNRVWVDSNVKADREAVIVALNGALAPVVGCFVGKCDRQELLQLQIVAKTQGFIWIEDVPSVQKLSGLLLRGHAGREKYLLYGYPQTSAQASELLAVVGAPAFVINNSPVAPELLSVFDAHPSITQLDLASFTTNESKLRSIFFRKQVVAVVGSIHALPLQELRDVVCPLGYDVVDFKQAQGFDQRDNIGNELLCAFERQIQAVQAPRCLVVGAPESLEFYQALEARIGYFKLKVVILQEVQVRVRASDTIDDEDCEDYSDEEQGRVEMDGNDSGDDNASSGIRWRKVLQALRPQLSQLLQSPNPSMSIDVVGFLSSGTSRIIQDVVAKLRPRFLGIIGHPFSFYQSAARAVCRRHSVAFVDLTHVSSSLEALEILETLVATTSHSVYCLDGFPRSSLPDAAKIRKSSISPPRYVAQQLWELDRRLGVFMMLIRFTTTLELLEERTPEHITRRMLDVAQDDVELASNDLVDWFATGKTRQITEVTCDRTLEDAQEEMDKALERVLRPNRATIKKRGKC
ncbi:Nucleoside diphosphate kinase 5 [Phytophthora citrophthora]|uniref:Nucleoside diphosphate kinase 5 n=1 Tax=Phytophthora citrophthora TaxID=4793 RepID=A0AAD9GH76_9STRA|nr:Nucleoside diphosphate kinase 5 [Phytophthora citrophthora]